MAFEGMEVEEVTGALSTLSALCSQLEQIIASTLNVVTRLETAWQGPDAAHFHAQWPGHHSQLQAALSGLQDMHTHVQTNLSAQQSASSGY